MRAPRSFGRLAPALFLAASMLAAEETPRSSDSKAPEERPAATAEPAKVKESALVRAARKSHEERDKRKKATIVINDEDVRQSRGKLTINHTAVLAEEEDAPPIVLDADRQKMLKELAAAEERVKELELDMDRLSEELDAVREDYFEEPDPSYRETVIQEKFAAARKRREAARKELEAARENLERLMLENTTIIRP